MAWIGCARRKRFPVRPTKCTAVHAWLQQWRCRHSVKAGQASRYQSAVFRSDKLRTAPVRQDQSGYWSKWRANIPATHACKALIIQRPAATALSWLRPVHPAAVSPSVFQSKRKRAAFHSLLPEIAVAFQRFMSQLMSRPVVGHGRQGETQGVCAVGRDTFGEFFFGSVWQFSCQLRLASGAGALFQQRAPRSMRRSCPSGSINVALGLDIFSPFRRGSEPVT